MKVEKGDRVQDVITGFEGIVVCITDWLNGCIRVGVQSDKLKDGKPLNAEYFDEVQVEILKKGEIKSHHQLQAGAKTTVKSPAGPAPIPQRQEDPKW